MKKLSLLCSIFALLCCFSCAPSPNLVILFRINASSPALRSLIINLSYNGRPTNEGGNEVPANLSQFSIPLTFREPIDGTLSIDAQGQDEKGIPVGDYQQIAINSDKTIEAVDLTLSPRDKCNETPGVQGCIIPPLGPDITFFGIWGTEEKNIWIVGSQDQKGIIFHWNGWSWTRFNSPVIEILYRLYGNQWNDVWAVGKGGTILHYDGKQWELRKDQDLQSTESIKGVWASGPDDAWGVGEAGSIWRYRNKQWTFQFSAQTVLTGIWGTDSSNIWVVSQEPITLINPKSRIMHLTTGNNSAAQLPTDTDAPLTSIYGNNSGNVWAAGFDNIIIKYEKNAWVTVCPKLAGINFFNNVWGFGNSVWAVGMNGAIRRPGALCSEPTTSLTAATLYGVWGSSPNDVWAVGEHGTILHYRP